MKSNEEMNRDTIKERKKITGTNKLLDFFTSILCKVGLHNWETPERIYTDCEWCGKEKTVDIKKVVK